VPRYVYTDAIKLRQVLINLIGNAIKFTKVGGVFIHITNVKSVDNDCILRFSVLDTGVGIVATELSELFVSFAQAQARGEKNRKVQV
ncbi:MAG: ATP-binding protein, partial [Pseudanabaena sp.]